MQKLDARDAMRPPCQPPTVLSPDLRRAQAGGGPPRRAARWSRRARSGPRGYHSTSTSPAASTSATTSAGSCRTKSRSTRRVEPVVEVPHLGAGVQARRPASRRERADGPARRGRPGARRPRGGSASTTRAPPPSPSPWSAASAGAGRRPRRCRPGTARRASLDHRRRQVDAGGVGAGLGEVRRDVARARSRPRRPGRRPRARRPGRAASARTAGRPARRPGGRRTPPRPRRTTTGTRASRAVGAVGEHALPVDGRRRRRRPVARLAATSPSRCTHRVSCCPALARQLADQRLGPAGQAGEARLDLLAVGEGVQPLGAGPAARPAPAGRAAAARSPAPARRRRSSSTLVEAAGGTSASAGRVSAHTTRTQLPVLEPPQRPPRRPARRSRRPGRGCWPGCRRCAAAASVSGYDAGTVTCFSSRPPRTRCSSASRTGRSAAPPWPDPRADQPSWSRVRRARAPDASARGRGRPGTLWLCPRPDPALLAAPPDLPGRAGLERLVTAAARAGCRGRAGATRHRQDHPGAAGRGRAPRPDRRRRGGPTGPRGGHPTPPDRGPGRRRPAGQPAGRAGRRRPSATRCAASAGSAPPPGSRSSRPACCCAASSATRTCPASAPSSSTRCTSGSSTPTSPWRCCVDVRANLRDDLLLVAMSATVEAERTAALVGGAAPRSSTCPGRCTRSPRSGARCPPAYAAATTAA